jgi:hypothetical protein
VDWIDTFMELTSGVKSPPAFRLWGAISTICAVLERRVWTTTVEGELFPNMYNILAGDPGSGKTLMVNRSCGLLRHVNGLFIAPDNPTKPTFLDSIEGSMQTRNFKADLPLIYSAIYVASPELGVFLPPHDAQFVADLTHLYDNPETYKAPRRTTRSIDIDFPTVNILAAATPSLLNDILPEAAWSQGFSSRLVFVYGVKPSTIGRNMFARRAEIDYQPLIKHLQCFFHDLLGEFTWEQLAQEAYNGWINSGMEPVPDYGRLLHYVSRREVHLLKLSMVSAVSAMHGLTITLHDFERAQEWLLTAERSMPDVFRAMVQKSDVQLLSDLHVYAYGLYTRTPIGERKELKEIEFVKFLENKTTVERIRPLIGLMESTGRIRRGSFPGQWVVNPLI